MSGVESKRFVVTDQSFGAVPTAEAVAARLGVGLLQPQVRDEDAVLEVLTGADVVLVQYAKLTRRVLAAMAPGATAIRYGIGVDNIDVDAARELGVAVAAVPDYGVDTVADHAVTLLLAALRRAVVYDRAVRAGRSWVDPASVGPIRALASTTVGLVGTGRVGTAVARRLQAFGITVIASDPFADPAALLAAGIRPVPLPELLATSDAVSLHAPATPSTIGMIDADALALMQPDAVLVNTARGTLVDSTALAAALVERRIAGAALDVVDPEPLPHDSPLWDAPNLLLTPHVSFYSRESLERLERLGAEEAERALLGQPLRCPVR